MCLINLLIQELREKTRRNIHIYVQRFVFVRIFFLKQTTFQWPHRQP